MERVERCCHSFLLNVRSGVKSSGVDAHVQVPFDLDVWRYLSKGKGTANGKWLLFEREYFERFNGLPNHWYYCLNQHGEGKAIDFPIKLKPYLAKAATKDYLPGDNGSVVKAQTIYCEKLSVYFVKRACNINNLN